MTDLYKQLETKLDRAVDSAIARENARWIAEHPEAFQPREAKDPELCSDCGLPFDDSVTGRRAAEAPTKCRSCRDLDIQAECEAEQEGWF